MAKKEYTIKLVLDDSMGPTETSSTFSPRFEWDHSFQVIVNTKSIRGVPIDLAAHELGHVLGAVFKTPRHLGDPRVSEEPTAIQFMHYFGPTAQQRDGMLASEQEAWELAEKMYPGIDPKGKKWALGTYEKA